MQQPRRITIDGPAGSGKSTIGEQLAHRLGYLYIDTGAMYRAVTWLALQGIKRVVVRPRPSDADPTGIRLMIARPKGSSWPSSHPAVLTTFTRVATRELRSGAAARTAFTGLDLGVATSRVYLGVHYPSDVASGLLFGRAMARLWPRGRS